MVSDQEIAKSVETLLRQAHPNAAVTTLTGVVQQLEAQLGESLSHKAGFIRDQINNLRSELPVPPTPKDHFALQYHPHPHPQQIPSHSPPLFHYHHHPHFPLQHHQQPPLGPEVLHFQSPLPPLLHIKATAHSQPPQLVPLPQQQQSQLQPQPRSNVRKAPATTSEMPKESSQAGTKRRGGSGGLNKVCGVSPELQAVVGQPALPRTEIVKQLWVYIRKNNLQDPSNKRKIICDEALRVVFQTDSTDMFKMNKLLAKHIIPLEPTKEAGQAKRTKIDANDGTESAPVTMVISEALAKFLGTGEMEMDKSKAERCVWEYIKANCLEDPLNPMVIVCDAKLQGLFGCQNISAIGIQELLSRHIHK